MDTMTPVTWGGTPEGSDPSAAPVGLQRDAPPSTVDRIDSEDLRPRPRGLGARIAVNPEHVPPHSDEAEISVLGGMLLEPEAVEKAVTLLSEDDLFQPAHRHIFRAIRTLYEAGSDPSDAMAVREELRGAGVFEEAGGSDYLAKIVEIVPTAANLPYHARVVVQHANRRRLIEAAQEIAREAYSPNGKSSGDLVGWAAAAVAACAKPETDRGLRLVDDLEMEERPEPDWLVDGMLPSRGLGVLYGAPGCGKGFVALDLAFSLATGTRWMGREVTRGPVVYLAAEGSAGLGARIRAWKIEADWFGRAGVHFVSETISLLDAGAISKLIARLLTLPEAPVLLVVDTVARTMIGGDENSTRDMSLYVAGADRIREETGAAVLLVHHTNKGGEQERGNTALRGAADVMMALRKDDPLLRLECSKQREAEEFDPVVLRIVSKGESAVAITANEAWQLQQDEMTENERSALESLSRDFLEDGAAASAWCKACGIPERSFFRARTALVRKGYAEQKGTGRGARYVLAEKGKEAFTANCQLTANSLPGSDPKSLPASHTPIRGGRQVAGWPEEEEAR